MTDIVEEGRRHIERDHLRDEVLAEIQSFASAIDVDPAVVLSCVREALGRLS